MLLKVRLRCNMAYVSRIYCLIKEGFLHVINSDPVLCIWMLHLPEDDSGGLNSGQLVNT